MKKGKKINTPLDKKIHNRKNETLVFWMYAISIFAYAFILYGHTLKFGFVLDDGLVNQQNAFVQKGFKGIPEILSNGFLAGFSKEIDLLRPQYRPFILIQLAIEKQLWGINPFVNHFFNIFYYALTGTLLFSLLKKILINASPSIPFMIAMLFMAHPIHTEVVSNIKSRDEIMCFLFLITSLLTLYQFTVKRKKILFFTSILTYCLALLTKENAIPFLVAIPLFLYCFTKEDLKKILLISLSFLAVVVAFLFLRSVILQKTLPQLDPLYNSLLAIPTLSHRIATAVLIIGKYFRLLVFPHPLVWDYSYNQIPEAGWINPYVIISVAICIALISYAFIKLKSRNIFAFGILYFFIALSITANIFFYIGSTMAERFLYIPSLGFCMILFFLLKKIFYVDSTTGVPKQVLFYSTVIVILMGYSYKTIARSKDWKDNFTLYSAGIRDSPKSAKTHLAVANEFSNYALASGDTILAFQLYQKSEEEYLTGLNIYPNNADGWSNLGVVYVHLKNNDAAQKSFEKAIAIEPSFVRAYNNMGSLYAQEGKYKEAIPFYEKAIAIDSNYAEACGNIAYCYSQLGDYTMASIYYNKALKINPYDANIKRNMEAIDKMILKNSH